jgi:hypothetical protein
MKNFLLRPIRSATLASANAGTSSHILCAIDEQPHTMSFRQHD